LFLSVALVMVLAFWSSGVNNQVGSGVWWALAGLFIVSPLGVLMVLSRRRLTWSLVIQRMELEESWTGMLAWVTANGRRLFGLTERERVAIEERFVKQSKVFVKAHWNARDIQNDNQWFSQWAHTVTYCLMLLFGTFALIEYRRFGIGAMEVGTLYALWKIYTNVGKYMGNLVGVSVKMQGAVVSVRRLSALLNMKDQRSMRGHVKQWTDVGRDRQSIEKWWSEVGQERDIVLQKGTTFVRPHHCKEGAQFAELMITKELRVPLGRVVLVSAGHEGILMSVLGLVAQVIQPEDDEGRVRVPQGVRCLMPPVVAVGSALMAETVGEELALTGVNPAFCEALAQAVGLDPRVGNTVLSIGQSQVLHIIKALLIDPDVMCLMRPMTLVPYELAPSMAMLLRVWQGCGGAPGLASVLGVQGPQDPQVFRSPRRTLVMGNVVPELFGSSALDCSITLEEHLWQE